MSLYTFVVVLLLLLHFVLPLFLINIRMIFYVKSIVCEGTCLYMLQYCAFYCALHVLFISISGYTICFSKCNHTDNDFLLLYCRWIPTVFINMCTRSHNHNTVNNIGNRRIIIDTSIWQGAVCIDSYMKTTLYGTRYTWSRFWKYMPLNKWMHRCDNLMCSIS